MTVFADDGKEVGNAEWGDVGADKEDCVFPTGKDCDNVADAEADTMAASHFFNRSWKICLNLSSPVILRGSEKISLTQKMHMHTLIIWSNTK